MAPRLLCAGAVALGTLAAGCAPAPEPRPAAPQPDLTPVSTLDEARLEALGRFGLALDAARSGNPDAAYELLLQVVDRCGSEPLGQQALLMLAIGELHPGNPDPRLHLAAEASARLAHLTPDTTWTHRVAEALYLLSRRLAPRSGHLAAMDVQDLRARVERATDGRLRLPRVDCSPVWPAGTPGDGSLPELRGLPYPVQVAGLRRELRDLRREVERLRRLMSRSDSPP